MTGEFNIPDEVVEAAARTWFAGEGFEWRELDAPHRMAEVQLQRAALQAALSAWGATELTLAPDDAVRNPHCLTDRPHTRLTTPWVPVKEGKEQ